jgi:hypothetical protein
MRNTSYARELDTPARVAFDASNEGRIEHILVKENGREENGQKELRFSWWKDGRMMMRPLDLPESHLLELLHNAIEGGIFTPDFLTRLRQMLPNQQ